MRAETRTAPFRDVLFKGRNNQAGVYPIAWQMPVSVERGKSIREKRCEC
jgi:hypothetical protein